MGNTFTAICLREQPLKEMEVPLSDTTQGRKAAKAIAEVRHRGWHASQDQLAARQVDSSLPGHL